MNSDTRRSRASQPSTEDTAGTARFLRGAIGGALGYVARSALDLHRYRYVRTRMLHDSLRKLDGVDSHK